MIIKKVFHAVVAVVLLLALTGCNLTVRIQESSLGYCVGALNSIENEHAGFTGDGYINSDNAFGAAIDWKINGQPGTYKITWRYANGSPERPAKLLVDGVEVISNIAFETTGAWSEWQLITTEVDVDWAPQQVRLESTNANGLANIDYVEIESIDVKPVACDSGGTNTLVGFAAENGGTIGGQNGETVTVATTDEFLNAIRQSEPLVIQVDGTIFLDGMHKVASNKTIKGVGSKGVIQGGGLNLDDVSNIIIQNMRFTDSSDDAINIQYSNNIWIDHCEFNNAFDGLVDIKRASDFITVSWNHFTNHHKTALLGASDDHGDLDSGRLRVTYHHNWFDHTSSRHPRVRFSRLTHVYNNLYEGNNYGVASTMSAEVLVENNYFWNVNQPTLVGYGTSGDGDLVQRGNVFISSGSPETKNSVPEPGYSYSLDDAVDLPAIVKAGAGRKGY